MVRSPNEKSYKTDERINERGIRPFSLLWEDFSQKVLLYDISFCPSGGDGEVEESLKCFLATNK